jgi:DsbC/DsbD-like thiol-disulfide interchange protein
VLHSTREKIQRNPKALIAAILVLSWRAPFGLQPVWSNQNGAVSGAADTPGTTAIEVAEVKADIYLSRGRATSGQKLGVLVKFEIAPGWHVYGEPLPEEYTPTSVVFDNALIAAQELDFPKPTLVKFELLGETMPVYQGRFTAAGSILLRQSIVPGVHGLAGTITFQECDDNLCKMPQQERFEIPLRIDSRTAKLE